MRWLAAASLALFLTLSQAATAQVRGMGTAPGSVRAGSSSGIQIGGTFSNPSAVVPPGIHIGNTIAVPPFGFRNPNFPHHHFPRTFGYVLPYGPYYYGGYAPYAMDYGDYPGYTGYVAGTFDASPYPGYPYPAQYAPPPNYYSPYSSPPPVNSAPAPQSYQQRRSGRDDSASDNAEPTVLVFRDGHRQEVANYAIMGSTLFVLSGPRSKIPIAELDVPATERVNQSRGIEFHVPKGQ
jgi:hypothetical protein